MHDTPDILAADQLTRTDTVRINSGSTVKDVAEYLGVPVPDVIKQLMSMGVLAMVTKTLADEEIQLVADALDKEIVIVALSDEAEDEIEYDDAAEDLVERPPVVTIMGHVDHGKTSLLDAMRKTDVAAGEAGGITQHIGAYQVHHNGKTITFLDTPGHQAFTAMRARGARVTDIAIIVVAADDGARPQTDEAIDHANAADVPIIVAVNKIDKEGADPTRVRTELTQRGLQPSEWGGETEYVDVSAKAGTNLEDLLDTILVVAELEELEANPTAEASGVVIESKLDPGRGPVVTVLIQRGTLRIGESIVAGPEPGRVRAMIDYRGERVTEAVPGDPVEILGFDGVPDAGEVVRVVESDKEARRLAAERETREKSEAIARRSGRKVSFEDVFKRARQAELAELPLVIKGDVAGSVEALEDEIARLPQDEVRVDVLHSGVGGINESDVMLAAASEAVIIGFNVRPVGDAAALADRQGVEIRNYSVIYAALDDLRAAMTGLLAPEIVEDTIGTVEVRQTFRASKIGIIAGSYVTDGVVRRGSKVRVVRDGTVLADTTIDTLRRFNDDAREVAAGYECGIVLDQLPEHPGGRRAGGLRDPTGGAPAPAVVVAGFPRGSRMSPGGARMRRVDEAVREVLGDAVTKDLKDPRVGFVTVTEVRTSADLRQARVFVSVLGTAGGEGRDAGGPGVGARHPPGAHRPRAPDEADAGPGVHARRHRGEGRQAGGAHRGRHGGRGLMDRNGATAARDQVLAEIRSGAGFCLVTHEHPDGDALGSLVAMHRILTALGKDSVMLMAADEFPLPYEYRFFDLAGLSHGARRPTCRRGRSSTSTAATSTATRWGSSRATTSTSSTSTTTTTTRASARSTWWTTRRRARPRSSGT